MSLGDSLRIAIERAGRLVSNLPHGTCVWSEANELLSELEFIFEELDVIQAAVEGSLKATERQRAAFFDAMKGDNQ